MGRGVFCRAGLGDFTKVIHCTSVSAHTKPRSSGMASIHSVHPQHRVFDFHSSKQHGKKLVARRWGRRDSKRQSNVDHPRIVPSANRATTPVSALAVGDRTSGGPRAATTQGPSPFDDRPADTNNRKRSLTQFRVNDGAADASVAGGGAAESGTLSAMEPKR
jgi:hypothetical protein